MVLDKLPSPWYNLDVVRGPAREGLLDVILTEPAIRSVALHRLTRTVTCREHSSAILNSPRAKLARLRLRTSAGLFIFVVQTRRR
jgi:hypothetical protein